MVMGNTVAFIAQVKLQMKVMVYIVSGLPISYGRDPPRENHLYSRLTSELSIFVSFNCIRAHKSSWQSLLTNSFL